MAVSQHFSLIVQRIPKDEIGMTAEEETCFRVPGRGGGYANGLRPLESIGIGNRGVKLPIMFNDIANKIRRIGKLPG
jgi:hypothetical protein